MSEFRRRLMKQKAGGYELVDHILTNGLAYIDTGYFVNPNTEVEISCRMEMNDHSISLETTTGNMFFVGEETYVYTMNHGGGAAAESFVKAFYYWPHLKYGQGGVIKEINSAFSWGEDYTFGFRYIDDVYYGFTGRKQIAVSPPAITFSSPLIFLISREGFPYCRTDMYIYSFKISERGTIVKHFLPAKQGNIYGMAEIIEGKFYASPNGESFDY